MQKSIPALSVTDMPSAAPSVNMSSHRNGRGRVFGEACLQACLLGIALLYRSDLSAAPRLSSMLAVVTSVYVCVAIARRSPGGATSVGGLYMLTLTLFHAGLLVFFAFNLPVNFFDGDEPTWFVAIGLGPAGVTVMVAALSFGAMHLACTALKADLPAQRVGSEQRAEENWALGIVGLLLLASGAVLFLGVFLSEGFDLIGTSYVRFLQLTEGNDALPASFLLMGLGAAVTAASDAARVRTAGLIVFACFSIPATFTGFRGSVVFPALAWAVVAARRRGPFLRPAHVLVLLAALSAGAAVREFRDVGFSWAAVGRLPLSPLNGLAELGGSLRPVVLVQTWQDFRHEAPLGFSSYLDPLDRLVNGRILGVHVVPAEQDPRAMISVIAHRAGQIGGSSIAEGYYAAGIIGVVVALGLLGLVVALLDGLPKDPTWNAFVGGMAVILFIWIRNDSTPVAGQLLLLAAVLIAIRASGWALKRRPV
jgi:hypothetical protein